MKLGKQLQHIINTPNSYFIADPPYRLSTTAYPERETVTKLRLIADDLMQEIEY